MPNPVMELVGGKYVISDGTRTIDVVPMPAFDHAADMLIAYLPHEKMVVNADVYEPPMKGGRVPRFNEGMRMLLDTEERFGMDVSWEVGVHSGMGPHDELVKIAAQAGAKN
jgi:hypothetical protein